MQNQSAIVPVPEVFCFESHEVRTVERDGEVWFVLNDVCQAIGINHAADVARRLDDDEKQGVDLVYPHGGTQKTTVINESGLYSVILRSDKPTAKPFKKWVTSEVLPSIRKHGHYSPVPVAALPTDPMQLLKLTYDALEQVSSRVAKVETVSLETKNRMDDFEAQLPLRPHEARAVQVEVTAKVAALEDRHGIHRRMGFMAVYGFVKRHFVVPTYSAVPSRRFDEALSIIKGLTIEQLPRMVQSRGGVA